MSSSGFYRAFEERYRGSRELIRERLRVYLPFIAPLRQLYKPAAALDLGCGRGEWLELLQEAGFQPQGIDLDEGMLKACTELGLPATRGDGIAYLESLGDESQCVVSAFHVVEHISFDELETLVAQSLRVLKPGGLLILETPNPENPLVGACRFFLDPSHLRPIPPLLLSFVPEFHGFARVQTLRLQEQRELHERSDVSLMEVLDGASPDYAVVAQKAAPAEVPVHFDAAFAQHHGIELHELAERYDGKLAGRMDLMEQRLAQAEAQQASEAESLARIATLQDRLADAAEGRAHGAEALAAELKQRAETAEARGAELLQRAEAAEARGAELLQRAEAAEARAVEIERHAGSVLGTQAQELAQRAHLVEAQLQQAQARVDELGGNAHHWWQQACSLEAERNDLKQSWSWRVMAPLRFLAGLVVHPVHTLRDGSNCVIHACERPLSRLMATVLRRSELSHRITRWLTRHYPALHARLLDVASRHGVVSTVAASTTVIPRSGEQPAPLPAELSPRAHQIYTDLRAAIEIKRTR